ncbi:MAG: HEPN domain-containing protein [Candidatus Omnitrophota bacterium]|nr:HEPN domain-containing protein [Candidatus Omnitrophota bacterium]
MKSKLVREWVLKAEEDYFTVEVLTRQRKKRVHNSVCFHAQQCAEKYLKALLVSHKVPVRKTHDLGDLADTLQSYEPTLTLIADLLDGLTPYAAENRYPGEDATGREAKAASKAMKEIRRFARSRLKLSV